MNAPEGKKTLQVRSSFRGGNRVVGFSLSVSVGSLRRDMVVM